MEHELSEMAGTAMKLAGVPVVVGSVPHPTIRAAGLELRRFLYRLTGVDSPVRVGLPESEPTVVLNSALAAGPADYHLAAQGYRVKVGQLAGRAALTVVGGDAVGVLYGVYGLLEFLGMGFYAGGETYPEIPVTATLPGDFCLEATPAFKMRCNVLLMHWYDGEPGAAYAFEGEYLAGGPTPNSLSKPWGAVAALRTSEFSFGTGRYFDSEIYTSPAGEAFPDLLTEIKNTEAMWAEATGYARDLGVHIAAGFEEPRGDPTDQL